MLGEISLRLFIGLGNNNADAREKFEVNWLLSVKSQNSLLKFFLMNPIQNSLWP